MRLFTLAEASRFSVLYRCLACLELVTEDEMQDHFERVHRVRIYGVDLRAQFRREVVAP